MRTMDVYGRYPMLFARYRFCVALNSSLSEGGGCALAQTEGVSYLKNDTPPVTAYAVPAPSVRGHFFAARIVALLRGRFFLRRTR